MIPTQAVVDWLLASDEPAARWIVQAHLLGAARQAAVEHRAVLDDPATERVIARLPDWTRTVEVSGHQHPSYGPNLLDLLADMGVGGGDDERIERLLDDMLASQLDDGRFAVLAESRTAPLGAWGSLLCDTHAITEVLLRYGRGDDPRVQAALRTTIGDLADTAQGRAWPCRPDDASGFRGPGRKHDLCPQATLEALRAWSYVDDSRRPAQVHQAARVALAVWRGRAGHQPYMFGHGARFKTVKWPTTWYDVAGVLDTLGRYPALWRGPGADAADRRSLGELVACLIAYNVAADGRVTPQSCYRGFEDHSFGQKKRPSPFATARVYQVLHRLDDLLEEAAAVDVTALASSKGGAGTARPPRSRASSLQ